MARVARKASNEGGSGKRYLPSTASLDPTKIRAKHTKAGITASITKLPYSGGAATAQKLPYTGTGTPKPTPLAAKSKNKAITPRKKKL